MSRPVYESRLLDLSGHVAEILPEDIDKQPIFDAARRQGQQIQRRVGVDQVQRFSPYQSDKPQYVKILEMQIHGRHVQLRRNDNGEDYQGK